MSGYTVNITGDQEIYHIYAKDRCLYNCLSEEEFKEKWSELKAMVGLMKTDYTEDDLSFTKVDADIGHGGGSVSWNDPVGDPSY